MAKPVPQLRVPSPLRLRRITAGLTLYDVAKAVGRSVATVSNIERGHSPNSARDLPLLDAAILKLAAGVRP